MTCAKPSMKSALAPAKNKNNRTSACDSGGPAACNAATLLGSGEIPSLENTLPKNVTARRLNRLFLILRVSPCARQSLVMLVLRCPIDQDVVIDADGVGFQRHNFTYFFVEYFCRAVDPEV